VLDRADEDKIAEAPFPVADERDPETGVLVAADGSRFYSGGEWIDSTVAEAVAGGASFANGVPMPPLLTIREQTFGPSARGAEGVAATRRYRRRVAAWRRQTANRSGTRR
jgi:hypothetical protein